MFDGVIRLSAAQEGAERQRYLEVYERRNTAYSTRQHKMIIGAGGITVVPRVGATGTRGPTKQRRRS